LRCLRLLLAFAFRAAALSFLAFFFFLSFPLSDDVSSSESDESELSLELIESSLEERCFALLLRCARSFLDFVLCSAFVHFGFFFFFGEELSSCGDSTGNVTTAGSSDWRRSVTGAVCGDASSPMLRSALLKVVEGVVPAC
jgi:hypothetical protein